MITIKPSVRYLDDQYTMLKGHSGMESKELWCVNSTGSKLIKQIFSGKIP